MPIKSISGKPFMHITKAECALSLNNLILKLGFYTRFRRPMGLYHSFCKVFRLNKEFS